MNPTINIQGKQVTINNTKRTQKSLQIPDTDITNIQITTKIQNSNKTDHYIVTNKEGKWTCTCPDHTIRKTNCKHILKTQSYTNKYIIKEYIKSLENEKQPQNEL